MTEKHTGKCEPGFLSRSDFVTVAVGLEPTDRKEKTIRVASATGESAKQELFVVFDAVKLEQFDKFFLEGLFFMMLALAFYVIDDVWDDRLRNGKYAVTILPTEIGEIGKFVVNPIG